MIKSSKNNSQPQKNNRSNSPERSDRSRRYDDEDSNFQQNKRTNSYHSDDKKGRGDVNKRTRKTPKNTYKKSSINVSRPQKSHTHSDESLVRLNKYISNAGICSRRDADLLIAAGAISVNGVVVTTLGYKVKPGDEVSYGGEVLRSERKRYFLLNKPKGFITTLDDPHNRRTVMTLVENCCKERIYPVGRLDRNTTGLLLFTNDGEMAKKLTHPSSRVYKVYQVETDKPVVHTDMRQMLDGIELEDGLIAVDDVQYQGDDRRILGVALHSGKNRIVRRIFEHLGYEVVKLDRTSFAGLTKKDLPRGRVRELSETEVNYLKMI